MFQSIPNRKIISKAFYYEIIIFPNLLFYSLKTTSI